MKISPFTQAFHRMLLLWQHAHTYIRGKAEKRFDIGVLFKIMSTLNIMKENLNLVVDQGGLEH